MFEFSASVLCLERDSRARRRWEGAQIPQELKDCAVCCHRALLAEAWRCWCNLGAVCAGSPHAAEGNSYQRTRCQHEKGERIAGRKAESLPVTVNKETCDPGRGTRQSSCA